MSPRPPKPPQLDLFGGPATPPTHPTSAKVQPVDVSAELRTVAHAAPALVRVGTSSWSFPGWADLVYAARHTEAVLAREGLHAYAAHPVLRTVGVDRTYYGPVGAEVLAGYAAAVPADFRFLVKAHEACTTLRWPRHARYGARRGEVNTLFLDPEHAKSLVVEPFVTGLGDKAGPLLFQFPPQDVRPIGGPEAFAEGLGEFLRLLPRGPLYAVELRNPELLTPTYAQALRNAGAVHCANWHPSMPPIDAQLAALGPTASPLVVRWMLGHQHTYEGAKELYAPFAELAEPDPVARECIARAAVSAAREKRPVYVVINNKAEGCAPQSAVELTRSIVTHWSSSVGP